MSVLLFSRLLLLLLLPLLLMLLLPLRKGKLPSIFGWPSILGWPSFRLLPLRLMVAAVRFLPFSLRMWRFFLLTPLLQLSISAAHLEFFANSSVTTAAAAAATTITIARTTPPTAAVVAAPVAVAVIVIPSSSAVLGLRQSVTLLMVPRA